MKKFLVTMVLLGSAVSVWRGVHLLRTKTAHAIVLTWVNAAPTANNAPSITAIFRGTAPGEEDPDPIASLPIPSATNREPGVGTYSDSSGVPDTTYYYVVVEVNRAGSSPRSNETSARFRGDPPWYERLDAALIVSSYVVVLAVLALLVGRRRRPQRRR